MELTDELNSMDSLKWMVISCPYCGERLDVSVDCSVDYQQYIEDCQVCCRPMELSVSVDEHNEARVNVRHENE